MKNNIKENNVKLLQKVCVNNKNDGIIKFIGETKFAEGIWIGVELKKQLGKNNGTINDV